ncbi:MAG: hypothetical protein ICV60_15305 [Pyrinomonadaceae bacterium]|nr:hypothetical protein [Pyrinomonadaceae bacterium]
MSLSGAIAGELMNWRGLPEATTVEEALAALAPIKRVQESAEGERNNTRFQVVVVERAAPPSRVELWRSANQEDVMLIEWDNPTISDAAATLQAFGPPEWALEDKRFVPEGVVVEYIYASRGLTLSVVTPEPGAKPHAPEVVHVQLYRPGSVDYYLTTIGADAALTAQGVDPLAGFKDALAGRLAGWQGLPGSVTLQAITDALQPVRGAHAPVERERQSMRFMLTAFERDLPPQYVEVWQLYAQEHVTLVEYDDPPVEDLDEVLKEMGAPDLMLEDQRTAAGASVKEYIYARRGLALSLAEPYEWSELKERRAVHAQLYRASSINYYWRYVGPGPRLRPVPTGPTTE